MDRRHRILVVDDEPQLTRVLRVGLTGRGFDVRTVADAESALDTFADWQPDLVVTDLTMPDIDGIELCRRIRKRSQIPIIVLSVKDDGQGFDPALHSDGHGLGSMQRRAELLGTSLILSSAPGLGTLVGVELDITRIRD